MMDTPENKERSESSSAVHTHVPADLALAGGGAVKTKRPQSFGEEMANSISHGMAVIGAIIAAPFLISSTSQTGGALQVIGVSIFAVSVILLYLTSTLYHSLPVSKAKKILRVLDHGAIFLMIAGTYTPFTLGALRGTWGWTLLGLIWSLALIGIVLKVVWGTKYKRLSTVVYLTMGWLILVAVKPMLDNVLPWGLFWLLAGGIAYTVGVIFYAADSKIKYSHFIWHLFVIAGTTCHFIAVFGYSS